MKLLETRRGASPASLCTLEKQKSDATCHGYRGVAERCDDAQTQVDQRPLIDGDYNSQSLYIGVAQTVEHHMVKVGVAGSNPVAGITKWLVE